MLDIGWSELLVIGIVALVVIGPKELPGVLRSVGQMVSKLRRMAGEFQGQFQEALREAELDGLKKEFTGFADEANRGLSSVLPTNPLLDLENEVKAAKDAIEGRTDEPATKVDDATALAAGIDPVTAAVEAQLPKPDEPLPVDLNAFEADIPAAAGPELLKAETTPVEAAPLDEAAAKPKRKPRAKPVIEAADEPEVSVAVAALDGPAPATEAESAEKPKRKPRVKAVKPATEEEGPAS